MSNGVRILLRLLGVLLLVAGIAGVVLLFVPGPGEVAEWMGNSCARGRGIRVRVHCDATDVLLILIGAPVLILVGFIMALSLRPEGRGPITLDFSGRG